MCILARNSAHRITHVSPSIRAGGGALADVDVPVSGLRVSPRVLRGADAAADAAPTAAPSPAAAAPPPPRWRRKRRWPRRRQRRRDVRVFEVGGERWFGGGADLTPYYLYDEDAQTFHRFWHAVCERHACADHAEYKKWCDDYFYIPSRKEHRGVGGIFFDDLSSQGAQEFTQEVAEQWLASYLSIVEKRRQLAFTEAPLP